MSVVPLWPGHGGGKVAAPARALGGDSARALHSESSALLTPEAVARRYAAGLPMTLAAVALYCTVSVWTVRDWVDRGKLPVLRLPGRRVCVEAEALTRFLESCQA